MNQSEKLHLEGVLLGNPGIRLPSLKSILDVPLKDQSGSFGTTACSEKLASGVSWETKMKMPRRLP